MKKFEGIVINDFNKFRNIEIPTELKEFIKPKYHTGYWNVFKYTEELKKFLIENEISWQIESEDSK